MTVQLCCRRRLCLHTWQRCINACPTRRTRRPDRHRRVDKIRIVECPGSNVDQVRSRLGLAKERSAAIRAEPAVHSVSTVRHTREVAHLPCDLERRGAKANANRSTARAQVLAIAAPAHTRGDWWFRALPAHCTAKTPASDCHCPLQNRERRNAGSHIVRWVHASIQQRRLTFAAHRRARG